MPFTHPLKPLLAVCALLLTAAMAPAQNLTGYRYWFNDNAATMTVVDLTATPVVDTELILNSSSLPNGHHLVTIQFRDANGHWGAPWTTMFAQRGATMNALEYWFNDDPGATIANCVFTRASAPFWQSNGATLTNNLLVSNTLVSNMTGETASGNILGIPVGSIFMSEGDDDYQFSDDLRLQAGCSGVGAGTDGTDIGIFGTSSPYKIGAMPHVPHYIRVAVAPGTDANGDLRVQVKVAAQAN